MAKKSKKSKPAKPAAKPPRAAARSGPKAGPKPAVKPAAKSAGNAAKDPRPAKAVKAAKPVKAAKGRQTAKPASAAKKVETPVKPKKSAPVPPAVNATPRTKAPKPPRSPRKAKAAEPLVEASGRPVSKTHIHAGGETPDAVRGRVRAPAGPQHAGVSDDAVRAATGRGWEEWLALLDGEGATTLEHKAIATLLHEKHELDPWWSQTVTVGYEQARGLREKHQGVDGYQASMSKTINAPVSKLYRAWEDQSVRERWLGDSPLEIRTSTPDKSLRMTWLAQGPDEGSSVDVHFWPKEGNRGLVQVEQRKLADAQAVQRVKAFWSVKLENLRAVMEKA